MASWQGCRFSLFDPFILSKTGTATLIESTPLQRRAFELLLTQA
jgi:hypothetical protein